MTFGGEMQRTLRWCALALIFSGVGLSVFGAFLGAEDAGALFSSRPLAVYWGVFALTLAAGFVVFARMRRDAALAALHLGFLLVIAGFALGSDAVQRWTGRRTGRPRIPRSYLVIREGETAATVYDRSLRRALGELPFAVRLDRFEIEHYPLTPEPPTLFYGVLAPEPGSPHAEWRARPLKWTAGQTRALDGTPIRMRVTGFTPAAEGVAPAVRLALSAGGAETEHALAVAPGEPFARLALSPLFPELAGLDRSASLLLAPPSPAVKTYRSRVTVIEDGRERSAEILVNRPLRVAGYHLYQHSWGEAPARHTILLAVSDAGLRVVYAGFLLLGAGSVALYVRPRRGASA